MPNPDPNADPATAPVTRRPYRPKGKIVWMDKPVRDKINKLLFDGRSYPAILEALGPDAKDISVNLCRYHKDAYRHWPAEIRQARLVLFHAKTPGK